MTPEEQGTRNMLLVGRQLEYFLDHPEQLDDVDGREIVIIPPDDPELAAANQAVFERLTAQSVDAGAIGPVQLKAS